MSEHPDERDVISRPRTAWASWAALAVLLLLLLYPSPAFPWSPLDAQPSAIVEADYREIGAFLQANTSPDAVVAGDAYWLISWYGDRTSLWFPVDTAALDEIERRYVKVDAVFLTPTYLNASALTNPVWRNLYAKPKAFGEFTVIKEYVSAHGLRAVLYLKQEPQR
ncbi:MAG: hypothetical protein ACPL7R_05450 [Anaerolineae bacterium]